MLELLLATKSAGPAVGLAYALFSNAGANTGTEKIDYQTNAVVAGVALSQSRWDSTATGNYSIGLFACGWRTSPGIVGTVDRYNHAEDTSAPGTAMTQRTFPAAAGNATDGYVIGGKNAGAPATYYQFTEIHNYASGVNTGGANLGSSRANFAGVGTSEFGIFAGGTTTSSQLATARKYTYAGNTVVAATSLTSTRYGMAAAGTASKGYFFTGGATKVDIYDYGANTVMPGTNATASYVYTAGAGNSEKGIFSAAVNHNTYTYATDAVVAATAFTYNKQEAAACSSTPGGF